MGYDGFWPFVMLVVIVDTGGHCGHFKQETVDSRPWHGGSAPAEHDRGQVGEAGEGCEGACFHAGGLVKTIQLQ